MTSPRSPTTTTTTTSNPYSPNRTPISSNPGTLLGIFGHSNINQPSSWSWSDEVQSRSNAGESRREELRDAKDKSMNTAARNNNNNNEAALSLPYLQSAYDRGLLEVQRMQQGGIAAISGLSKLDMIQSRPINERDPITGIGLDIDNGKVNGKVNVKMTPKPPPEKKYSYNPVLQRYPDEVPHNHDSLTSSSPSRKLVDYNITDIEEKERLKRIQKWTPGSPKGGRHYLPERLDLKDGVSPSTLNDEVRTREKYAKEYEGKFNRIYQVHADPTAEIEDQRAMVEKSANDIERAKQKNLVRSGGYNPINLCDSRTGEAVGPVIVNGVGRSDSGDSEISRNNIKQRTGSSVAHALGSDRHGSPPATHGSSIGTVRRNGENRIDNVQALKDNQGRIEKGEHDLEMRYVQPTGVHMLIDANVGTFPFEPAHRERINENIQVDPNAAGFSSRNKGNDVYIPSTTAYKMLHTDTQSSWAPHNDSYDYTYIDGIVSTHIHGDGNEFVSGFKGEEVFSMKTDSRYADSEHGKLSVGRDGGRVSMERTDRVDGMQHLRVYGIEHGIGEGMQHLNVTENGNGEREGKGKKLWPLEFNVFSKERDRAERGKRGT